MNVERRYFEFEDVCTVDTWENGCGEFLDAMTSETIVVVRIFHYLNTGVWGAGSNTLKEERLTGSDVGCKKFDNRVVKTCLVKTGLAQGWVSNVGDIISIGVKAIWIGCW